MSVIKSEKRFFSHLKDSARFIDLSLYLVTNRSQVGSESAFLAKVLECVEGGVTCVQLREEELDKNVLLSRAIKLNSLLRERGIPLIINDHVDITQASGAAGVHLGQKDMPYHEARQILGPHAIIGLSVDTWEDVERADALDVDYLGVSHLFATSISKIGSRDCWGLEGLKKIRAYTRHRLVPIGGITLANLADVCPLLDLKSGRDGVAMVGELWRSLFARHIAHQTRLLIQRSYQEREGHV